MYECVNYEEETNFHSYEEYCDFVKEEWALDGLDYLINADLVIDEPIKYENGENSRSIQYRLLTEEEFNKRIW